MHIPPNGTGPIRALTAVLCAGATCWALSSCGAEGSSAAPAAPVLPRAVPAHEANLLYTAEQILLRQCMSAQGFKYWIAPRAVAPPMSRFLYVVDDVGWARRHGFGSDVDRRMAKLHRSDPNMRYFTSLSPARQQAAARALNGERFEGLEARLPSGVVAHRSDSSCTSQAQRSLYGDLPRWFRVSTVAKNLTGVRVGRVTAHPSFVSATRRWATCMRARHHPFSNPYRARDVATRTGASSRVITERRIAVAEAECAQASGLSATARRLDQRYARDVRNEYRADIGAARSLQIAALPRARTIVGQQPTQ